MKAKSLIVSLILIVCFAGIGIGLYCAWPAITGTITDSKYYTSEDLQDAYDKGYDDAFKSKDELTQQVDYYKELTDTYYISILDYQEQIGYYESLNEKSQNTIAELEQSKNDLQLQVENLTEIKNNNDTIINDLNEQVEILESEIEQLTHDVENKDFLIKEKSEQIDNLQASIDQLQRTNNLNNQTIISLNNQIETLTIQISDMSEQIQNNSGNVTALNNKIAELEKSISYYEQYIASLESNEQVVATFEFNGSVYQIQIVNKNSTLSIVPPTNTDYVIFNGWTVDGEFVDLSSYKITTNTKFVADVTYRHKVEFKVDLDVFDTQFIENGQYVSFVESPVKEGYEFDGWTLNGVDVVDPTQVEITDNTTFLAKFTKLHHVSFVVDNVDISVQSVRNGNFVVAPTDPEKENMIFIGWSNDGGLSFVDFSSYQILSDCTFTAIFEEPFGLFNDDGDIIMLWDDLLDNEYFVLEQGVLNKGANHSEFQSFTGELIVPDDVLEIGNSAFYNCSINSIILSDSVEIINDNAFYSCDNLSSIIIPNSVTKIGSQAFYRCNNLDEVILSNSLTEIGSSAFAYTNISSINLPETLISLGSSAFQSTLIVNVTIPNSVNKLGSALFKDCTKLTSVVLPEGIEEIPNEFLSGCSSIASFVIPDSVISVGISAFYDCSSLESIVIGKNVSSLGSSVFSGCAKLDNVVIPYSVNKIGSYAFNRCTSLTNLVFEKTGGSIDGKTYRWFYTRSSGGSASFGTFPSGQKLIEVFTKTYVSSSWEFKRV